MSRRPARFSETDVVRLLRAALKAGVSVKEVRIDESGSITVSCGGEPSVDKPEPEASGWRGRLAESMGWDQ